MTKKVTQTASVQQLRQDIAQARIDLASGKLKNTRLVFNLRHRLARLLTHP